jgi:hypothetical protein
MCIVTEYKECKECKEILSVTKFNKNQRVCKPCRLEIKKEKRRYSKKQLVALRGGKCEICKYDRCVAALDFHHIDPDTKENHIAHLGMNFKAMVEEAKKCIMVCSNCHRELHAGLIKL